MNVSLHIKTFMMRENWNTNISLLRQEKNSCRLFVAHHATRRNKLKKKTANYLESDVFQRAFASDF